MSPGIMAIMVGLILSSGHLSLTTKQSKKILGFFFGLKQSLTHSLYMWSVFKILSPYCYNYPFFSSLTHKEKSGDTRTNYNMQMYTRAIPCFTLLYKNFYTYKKGSTQRCKVIPENIF